MSKWVASNVASTYGLNMQVYTGCTEGEVAERNQGKRVVMDLTEGMEGITVTCDNFFTSCKLVEELLKKNILMMGSTIHKNREELPWQLLNVQGRAPVSSNFLFTPTHTLVSYLPKVNKNVLLLSTKHHLPSFISWEKRKPRIIMDYNSCKGSVDTIHEE